MKNIIFSFLLGITSTSCTQIQTQIQNTQGQVHYQNIPSPPISKPPSPSLPFKNISSKQKPSPPLLEYEVETIKRKIQTYIVIQ